MDKLRMVFEFLAPSTPVGFLGYGWVGACFVLSLVPILMSATGTWLAGVICTLVVYAPLWVRANRKREEQAKLHAAIDELYDAAKKETEEHHRQKKEENERNNTSVAG